MATRGRRAWRSRRPNTTNHSLHLLCTLFCSHLYAWTVRCFTVAGVGGANTTGPHAAAKGDKGADPEFKKGDGLVLYDLDADPAETTNLAHDAQHKATVRSMLARLTELLEGRVDA